MISGDVHIEVSGLAVTFRDGSRRVAALEDLSLTVRRRECLGIVGVSGSGKSTLLNVIAGFVPPTRGQIRVDGRNVAGPGPDRGVVFQQNNLFPWMTVKQNVAVSSVVQGLPADQSARRVDGLLHEVGVEAFADFYPDALSVGMQQRVAIARAYASEPAILLMDEPFGSLDVGTAAGMRALLLDIRRERPTTIVFVTHNIEEAIAVSDRVVVLSNRPAHVKTIIDIALPYPRRIDAQSYDLHKHLEEEVATVSRLAEAPRIAGTTGGSA